MVGNQTRVKVVKNKMAPPFRVVEFDIMYGEGISKLGELIDLGVQAGVVEKSGSWFSYDGQRIGQGRENAENFLRANAGSGRLDRGRRSAPMPASSPNAMMGGAGSRTTEAELPRTERPSDAVALPRSRHEAVRVTQRPARLHDVWCVAVTPIRSCIGGHGPHPHGTSISTLSAETVEETGRIILRPGN